MKRGLIALFVVAVLMLNVIGVTAMATVPPTPALGQNPAYGVQSSTDTISSTPIAAPETPIEQTSETGTFGDLASAKSEMTWSEKMANSLASIKAYVVSRFETNNRISAVTSVRGLDSTSTLRVQTAIMPLFTFFSS